MRMKRSEKKNWKKAQLTMTATLSESVPCSTLGSWAETAANLPMYCCCFWFVVVLIGERENVFYFPGRESEFFFFFFSFFFCSLCPRFSSSLLSQNQNTSPRAT